MRYILRFKSSNDIQKDARDLAKKSKIQINKCFGKSLLGCLTNEISDKEVELLKTFAKIEVEPDYDLHPCWAVENVRNVDLGSLSGVAEADTDIDVFVLDSGVDASHPSLNVVESRTFMPDSTDVSDVVGHGTQVAGCIGSRENEIGIAPGAKIHSFRITNDAGISTSSAAISAIDAVIDFKTNNPSLPVVVNLAHGVNTGSTAYTALDLAVQNAVQIGIVVVVAAGNERKDVKYFTPAHTTEAIVVGAFDKTLRFTTFSNYGRTLDILAPGQDVTTTSNDPNARSTLATGTSISSAFVAGACALLLVSLPNATPQEIRDELVRIAQEDTSRVFACPIFTVNIRTVVV